MMKRIILLITFVLLPLAQAQTPSRYTDLLDYVQPAPDQGKTGTCLYVASTGAMELIANKLHDIRNPQVFGPYDLSEPFLINAPKKTPPGKSFFEAPVYKFNQGRAVSAQEWLFLAWHDGEINRSAWDNQDSSRMTNIELPKIETIKLFDMESRYATEVLTIKHVKQVKEALIKYNSPILINYKDNKYWHVILIVGYDDDLDGECYQTSANCNDTDGAFYVRDSFGKVYETRDYDWFIGKANAAFVVKPI
jgi:hypothetical protein